MAIFYLRIRTFGRSQGKSGSRATSAAAYRSGERIHDERTGRVYDHRRRADVVQKEIVLPAHLSAQQNSLAWARNRTTLWNAAEHAESRRNSRVAREFVVALPHELRPEKRAQLTMQFAQSIADRYRSAVDVAIHAPRGDARNYHAHLLATTREITADGLGRKTTLELSGTRRHELGLPRWREEIGLLRKHWADLTNAALEHAHVSTRVTHLTRAERGLTPSARPPRLPVAAYHMERRGERSFIAEKIRERHRIEYERAQAAHGARVSDFGQSQRRVQHIASNARTIVALGGSMLRNLGTGVRAVWRELQGAFAAETPKTIPAPVPSAKSPALDSERNRESAERLSSRAELLSERDSRMAQFDEAALKAARMWLASYEMHRQGYARQGGQEHVQEHGASHASERSRQHDNDYSL